MLSYVPVLPRGLTQLLSQGLACGDLFQSEPGDGILPVIPALSRGALARLANVAKC